MLNRTTTIRITTRNGTLPMTLEQCTMQAHELVLKVKAADAALLTERVRLGVLLLQVRRDLKRGEWGIWLAGGRVHQKTAERCMRYAAAFADTQGELDKQKLFDCLHAADAEMFPSIEEFDEHRISLVRVDRAIAAHEADEWSHAARREAPDRMAPNRMGRSTSSSIISADELPRARVSDVAGQGMLVELFTPITRRIESVCRVYDTLSERQRSRLNKLNEFYDRKAQEIVGSGNTSHIPHPTSDIPQDPPRDGGAHGSPSVPPFIASSHLGAGQECGG